PIATEGAVADRQRPHIQDTPRGVVAIIRHEDAMDHVCGCPIAQPDGAADPKGASPIAREAAVTDDESTVAGNGTASIRLVVREGAGSHREHAAAAIDRAPAGVHTSIAREETLVDRQGPAVADGAPAQAIAGRIAGERGI